jgi:hypothetical protein
VLGGPVGEGTPVNDPPGVGATPVNRLVKETPRESVPVTVDVKGKPKPVSKLVTLLPCAFVSTSVEVKGKTASDGVNVLWMTVVKGIPCAFVPVEVKENG